MTYRWASAIVLLVTATAWATSAQSCCQRQACEGMRFIASQISQGYEACCQGPADQRSECISKLSLKANDGIGLVLAAKQACDAGDNEAIKDTLKKLRDLFLTKVVRGSTGLGQNQMIGLRTTDYVDFRPQMARTIAPNSWTYTVPAGTTATVKFREVFTGVAVAGNFSLVKTGEMPVEGTADVAVPSDATLTWVYLGKRLTMTLDKTCEYNTLRVDNMGRGTLGVAMTLSSKDRELLGLVQVGSTLYFAFPVQLAADWNTISLQATPDVPGSQITPTVPSVLAADDVRLATGDDLCGNTNGNPNLRDGAARLIGAMMAPLGCPSN